MSPSRTRSYRGLFLVAALVDLFLGVVFLFFSGFLFELLGAADKVPEGGYVPIIGAFLVVMGIGYALVYEGDFWRNRDLILVGLLYKLAYSAVTITLWALGDLPHVAFGVVFGVVDGLFFLLMLECWIYLRRYPRIDLELVAAHPEAMSSAGGSDR